MADLKVEAVSLRKSAGKLRRAPQHVTHPLKEFTAASKDLSAFGALGTLLGAKGDVQDGMNRISGLVEKLEQEWHQEAKGLKDVGKALDELDERLQKANPKKQG